MVGPNPYKLYSYAEVLHFGRIYVICYACSRYSLVSKSKHGGLDTRTTTWSCCLCGGEGRSTQTEPERHIREDTRSDPQRHPRAHSRITGARYTPRKSTQLRETVRETPKDRRRARG